MPKISVTLTEEVDALIDQALLHRRFKDKADFIRHAIMNELGIPDLRYQIANTYQTLDAFLQVFLRRVPAAVGKDDQAMKERAMKDRQKINRYVAGSLNGNVSRRPTDKSWREAVSNSASQAEDDPRRAIELDGSVDAENGGATS